MHVHMPERSVGQERAREAAHDWIRWLPLLERTYVTEGVHVRSRHVIPLLIPSPSLGFVSPRNAPRHAIPSASTSFLSLLAPTSVSHPRRREFPARASDQPGWPAGTNSGVALPASRPHAPQLTRSAAAT